MLDWTLRRLGVGSSAKLAEVGEWLMVDTMEQLNRQDRSRGRGRPRRRTSMSHTRRLGRRAPHGLPMLCRYSKRHAKERGRPYLPCGIRLLDRSPTAPVGPNSGVTPVPPSSGCAINSRSASVHKSAWRAWRSNSSPVSRRTAPGGNPAPPLSPRHAPCRISRHGYWTTSTRRREDRLCSARASHSGACEQAKRTCLPGCSSGDGARLVYVILILQLAFHDFLGNAEVCGDVVVCLAVFQHRTNLVDGREKLRGESPAGCLSGRFVQIV